MIELIQFTICDGATKRIVRTGRCQTSDLALQSDQDGQIILEGIKGDSATQQLNEAGDGLTSLAPPSVQEIKRRASELLDKRYFQAVDSGVTIVQGQQVLPTDRDTRIRLYRASSIALLNPAYTARFRLKSGAWHTATASQIAAALSAVDALDVAADAKHEELSGLISGAANAQAVADLLPTIRAFLP